MKIETRIKIEKQIAKAIVQSALSAGLTVSVFDGEEWPLKRSTDKTKILDALFSTDSDSLRFRDAEGEIVGFVSLIYGNDGYDVISDYTATERVESLLKPAIDLSAQLEKRYA